MEFQVRSNSIVLGGFVRTLERNFDVATMHLGETKRGEMTQGILISSQAFRLSRRGAEDCYDVVGEPAAADARS